MNRAALLAEAIGSAILAATVIGSGIAAQKLSGGNVALALLANSVATGAILIVIILLFGRLSGAHFNPAVSLAFAWRGEISWTTFAAYALVQTGAMVGGAWLAHLMFGLPVLQAAATIRPGAALALAEFVAAFGLVLTIFGVRAERAEAIPLAVGLYILAAYWFTASTSFANPAITIARSLSDTFAGIAPQSVPSFIAAQLAGAAAAVVLVRVLWPAPREAA